jgi:hypothetical protein
MTQNPIATKTTGEETKLKSRQASRSSDQTLSDQNLSDQSGDQTGQSQSRLSNQHPASGRKPLFGS